MARRSLLLAGVSALAALSASAGPLDVRLAFSYDDGKTWQEDYPQVQAGRKFRVRATYTIGDDRDDRDVVIASLNFPEKYTSMTKERGKGWYEQRHPVYWKSSKVNSFYDWTVDTAGLAPGTHCFRVAVGYWVKAPVQEHVSDDHVVYLTIE